MTVAISFILCFSSQAIGEPGTFVLEEATIAGINDAFDARSLTSERLVELYLNRIEAYDQQGPALNSIITVNPDALEEARALDAERQVSGSRSPLHGIPILVKDLIDTSGMPTTGGAIGFRSSIPPDDSFVVRRLREAGAIILGKTNTDDFAEGVRGLSSIAGQTRNPYDTSRVAGGSSGGTAAAIAANFAVVGLGTDNWGSIRLPASLNSLVGLRPTLGLVSRDGTMVQTLARDTIGPIARTVEDVAVVLDVISGFDPADSTTSASEGHIPPNYLDSLDANGLDGVRIGVASRFLSNDVPWQITSIMRTALDQLRDLGAEIVDPFDFQPHANLGNSFYNGFEYHMNNYLESLGPDAPFSSVKELVASGEYAPHLSNSANSLFHTLRGDIPPEEDPRYNSIQRHRAEVEDGFLRAVEEQQVDIVVYASVAATTPLIPTTVFWPNQTTWRAMNLSAFLGLPSITVPAGFTSGALPVGIEFLSQSFEETDLLRVAYAFEQATAHRTLPPSTPPLPVPGQQFTTVQHPDAIYTVIDNDRDSDFDNTGDTASSNKSKHGAAVGERDTQEGNAMGRLVAKFKLPHMPEVARRLERATLRLFLEDIAGNPAEPVSLFHSVNDNDLEELASDYEDGSYADTLLDLVQPTDMGQQYFDLEVTDLVLADYAADGDNPLSAFRLQVNEAVFVEDDQSHRYRFTMPGAEANHPELLLTFIPEPSTLLLAFLTLGVVGGWRRWGG